MTRTSLFFVTSAAAFAALSSFALCSSAAQSAGMPAENPAGAAGSAAATPLIAPPVAGGLSADQVAARAVATSQQLRVRTEQHVAAEHGVDAATAAFIPRVTLGARYTRLSEIDQPDLGFEVPQLQNQYAADATLEIPLSDYALRLPQLHEAASKDARAAALLASASELRIATEARVLYYQWARSRLQVEVAKRGLEQARVHLSDAQVARDTGVASNADVLSVDAQVSSAELAVTRAQATAELLDKRLRTLMHDTSGRGYEIGEDLREAAVANAYEATDERALVAAALERRLEPRALAQNAGAMRANADAALARELPRLDAIASALYANPNPRAFPPEDEFTGSWQAGLQLTFTPTDIVGGEANRSALDARARSLDAELADLNDSIELEVKQQLLALRESEAAVRTAERGLVSAEEAFRVRRMLFQNGRATSIELSDAENEWSRAQSDVIAARIDHRIARTRLAHATGEDVAGRR